VGVRERRPSIGWIPTTSDFAVASARLRCLLPSKYLRRAGWDSELLDRREPRRNDVVVFQKVYDDDAIALARSLRAAGTRVVFDLCDNHFYNPDDLAKLRERADRLQRMLELADVVSVSTEPLRELVPGKQTVLVDDALDEVEAPRRVPRPRLRRRLELVWYGNAGLLSPPFGLVHLPRVAPVLRELNARIPLRLTVISSSRDRYEEFVAGHGFPTRYVEWRFQTFPQQFAGHDVCILPIEANPFTVCKTANRVALSLKLGVPVIADPIPSFEPFAAAMLLDAWPSSLDTYARDVELRASHVRQGRALVAQRYAWERVARDWADVFACALDSRHAFSPT
jgi:hypothetical protein